MEEPIDSSIRFDREECPVRCSTRPSTISRNRLPTDIGLSPQSIDTERKGFHTRQQVDVTQTIQDRARHAGQLFEPDDDRVVVAIGDPLSSVLTTAPALDAAVFQMRHGQARDDSLRHAVPVGADWMAGIDGEARNRSQIERIVRSTVVQARKLVVLQRVWIVWVYQREVLRGHELHAGDSDRDDQMKGLLG